MSYEQWLGCCTNGARLMCRIVVAAGNSVELIVEYMHDINWINESVCERVYLCVCVYMCVYAYAYICMYMYVQVYVAVSVLPSFECFAQRIDEASIATPWFLTHCEVSAFHV